MSTSSSLSNTSLPNSGSPSISSSATTSVLSSVAEPTHRHPYHQITKMRDTNKLTSESSSLNFKQPASTSHGHLVRSHTRKSCIYK
jgi:hypothetical protein